MMKTILGILLIICGFLQLSIGQEVVFLTPNHIILGEAMEGELVHGSIDFVVQGEKPVHIERVQTSCGCTVAQLKKRIIQPGDTAHIPFTFNTKGYDGQVRKALTVFFEESDIPAARFVIEVNVKPGMRISPRFLNFHKIPLASDTLTDYIEIENLSDKPLNVAKIKSPSDRLIIKPQSVIIPPHKSQLISVSFVPNKLGRQDTKIIISSDYKPRPEVSVPVFIDVIEKQ